MALPNFPIRSRLIPYDDLGIQEVSPNLLSLGSDVDIILAALMAMGKNGSQMLQASKNNNLLTASSGVSAYADVGEHIVFGDFHLAGPNPNIDNFNLSKHLNYAFLFNVSNFNDIGTNIAATIFLLDSLGVEYQTASIFTFSDNGANVNIINSLGLSMILPGNCRLKFQNLANGKSCDLHLEAYAI